MTIREALNRKKRIFSVLIDICIILGLVLPFVSENIVVSVAVGAWSIFGIFFFLIIGSLFFIRCPACNGQWGVIAMYAGSPFSVKKSLKYCPYCGNNIDEEIPGS